MKALPALYQQLLHRPPPQWLERSGPFTLCWRLLRKWLSASVIPFVPFNWMRIQGYRLVGFEIGRNVFIGMHCYMDDMHPKRTIIEDDVVVSYRVTFACHGPRSCDNRLILRQGCYIGCNATLLGGLSRGDIEVGQYASVGACSLVNRSIPPLATAVGQPAKIVRTVRTPWGSNESRTGELSRKYLHAPVTTPRFTPSGGEIRQSILIMIECDNEAQTRIHYTEDGTEPTEDSPSYNAPFRVDKTVVLKARAFKPGHLPSGIATANFTIAK